MVDAYRAKRLHRGYKVRHACFTMAVELLLAKPARAKSATAVRTAALADCGFRKLLINLMR